MAALVPRKQKSPFFSYFFHSPCLWRTAPSQAAARLRGSWASLPSRDPAQPAPRPGAAWAFPEWRSLLQALECDRAPAHLTQVTEPPADGALAVGGLRARGAAGGGSAGMNGSYTNSSPTYSLCRAPSRRHKPLPSTFTFPPGRFRHSLYNTTTLSISTLVVTYALLYSRHTSQTGEPTQWYAEQDLGGRKKGQPGLAAFPLWTLSLCAVSFGQSVGTRSPGSAESRCCCRPMAFSVLGEDRLRDIPPGFLEVRSAEKSSREERSGLRGGAAGGAGVFGCPPVCVDFESLSGGASMRAALRGHCLSLLPVSLSPRSHVFRVSGFGFHFGSDSGPRDDIGPVSAP